MAVYQYGSKRSSTNRSSNSSSSSSDQSLNEKSRGKPSVYSNSTDWLTMMKQCGDHTNSTEFSVMYPDISYCHEHKTINQRIVQRLALQSGAAVPTHGQPSKLDSPYESCEVCIKPNYIELSLTSHAMTLDNGGKDIVEYRDKWLGVRATQSKQISPSQMVEWNIAESQAFLEYQKQAWDLGVVRRLLMIKKFKADASSSSWGNGDAIITEEDDKALSKYDDTLRDFYDHCVMREVPCQVMCFQHTVKDDDDDMNESADSTSGGIHKIGDFVPMSMITRYMDCGICTKARRPKQLPNVQREMVSQFMAPQNASTYYASIEADAHKPRRAKNYQRR